MTEKKFDVLVVGELNVDLIMSGLEQFPVLEKEVMAKEMLLTLGSSSAIFASNLSAMGSQVAFAGMIGDDSFGELVLMSLRKKNVNCEYILHSEKNKTGCTVAIVLGKERAMLTYAGAMEEFSAEMISDEVLESVKHLHASSVFLQPKLKEGLLSLFLRAKKLGLSTSLDPQWDPEEKWDLPFEDLLPLVDVLLPNKQELLGLARVKDIDSAIQFFGNLTSVLVVKDGVKGARCIAKDGMLAQPAFINEKPVDAIGAGDSFDAGFIHHFIKGRSLKDCLRYASLMGALNTTASGGTGAFASKEEIAAKALKFFGEKI